MGSTCLCIRRTSGTGRGYCDRDDLQLAGTGAAYGECYLQPRLCAGAGMPAVNWADVCAGEPADGCGLSVDQSEDARVAGGVCWCWACNVRIGDNSPGIRVVRSYQMLNPLACEITL